MNNTAPIPTADNPNHAVEAFLKGYCEAKTPLHYAVLLTGKWGSGKTFFLTNFLKREAVPNLYVSLYGVGSVAEIEQLIFAKLHPILSSKAAKLGGLLLRGLAKGALKIDLDGDGKDDGSLSLSLPEAKLSEFANDASGRVLVFDDLERAAMPIPQILGFINVFVEHENMKAIIVAHDLELDRDETGFKRIKEKLIGQTLRIKPSVRGAYDDLLALVEDPWSRRFLSTHRDVVLDLFDRSGSDNLRVLKQSFWDFERIGRLLRPADRAHTGALLEILRQVLPIAIAIRTGAFALSDLEELASPWGRFLARGQQREPTALEAVEAKFPDVDFRGGHLATGVWISLLVDGYVTADALHASLDRNVPFISPRAQAAWRRAWHGFELSDADFDEAMHDLERDMAAVIIDDPGEVAHVFGALAQAAEMAWGGYTPRKAIARGRAFIAALDAAGRLAVDVAAPSKLSTDTGYAGLGYLQRDSETFRTLIAAYEAATQAAWRRALPRWAGEVLALLKQNPAGFAEAMSPGRAGHARYWNTPVLHHIAPADFRAALLGAGAGAQRAVLEAVKERATRPDPQLKAETRWYRELHRDLLAHLPPSGTLSRYRLERIIARTLPALTPPAGRRAKGSEPARRKAKPEAAADAVAP